MAAGTLLGARERVARPGGLAAESLAGRIELVELPQLAPWFANIGKRQRKAPKVYVRDTGLLHRLLGIDDATALPRHPKVGASWVGFVIEQLATMLAPRPVWYWRTQDGAEVDLLVELGGRRVGFEIKRTSAPTRTRSMHIALRDLELDRLVVVYAGDRRFPLADRIEAIGVAELLAAPPDQIAATIGH